MYAVSLYSVDATIFFIIQPVQVSVCIVRRVFQGFVRFFAVESIANEPCKIQSFVRQIIFVFLAIMDSLLLILHIQTETK